ncbi:MAG TPA: VCBS repeat-containing protein [Actinophytocola sp.]|uniref:FG-GAP repeat domain-containing protein n=1 Tax=Actinophytocola sp. TaxID=1872138 RepID=UPI002DB6FF25|nr:VCBS repeat-containing protein [Actinophytocola sp.]HEU5476181.1 VCBS repeat-containing protein [Actinophytocola sp.]
MNGDGLADLVGVQQVDADETAYLTWMSNGAGLYAPVRTWDSGPNTAFTADRIQPVTGDFNGDGRSDVAVLRDEGNNGITVWLFGATGLVTMCRPRPRGAAARTTGGWRPGARMPVTSTGTAGPI